MERFFKLKLTFTVKTGNLEEKAADSKEKRMIKTFLKVFLDNPELVDSYYKLYLLNAVADMNDYLDSTRDYLDISTDEKDYFFPAADKCPEDVKLFIKSLYADIGPQDANDDEIVRYKEMIERLLGELKIIDAEMIDITDLPGTKPVDKIGEKREKEKEKEKEREKNKKRTTFLKEVLL